MVSEELRLKEHGLIMTVTTYYLEMTNPADLRPKQDPGILTVTELPSKDLQFCKMLYRVIGEPWHWVDRNAWDDDRWQTYLNDDCLDIWVAYRGDELAGFYELQVQDDGDVEIVLLGLARPFIGKGLGGFFLTHALQSAWRLPGVKRVWLHTCSLDHENAVGNYKARGMRLYKTDVGS